MLAAGLLSLHAVVMQPRPVGAVRAGGHWIDSTFLDALYGGGRLGPSQRSAILDGADPAQFCLSDYDLFALTLGRLGARETMRSPANLLVLAAGAALVPGQAVWVHPLRDDALIAVDGSEESIAGFVGFTRCAALDGAPVCVYTDGRVPGFSGLVRQAEHFLYGAGLVGRWSEIPDGVWTRSLGPALSQNTLLVRPGDVRLKGIMPYKLNASGHMVPDTVAPSTHTYVAGAIIANNTAVYLKQADGKAYPMDGTEAAANAFLGIVAVGVAMGANATVYTPGTYFTTTGLSLVDGEVYAKEDGTLVAYGSVGSNKYTLCVLEADGTNSGSVIKGEVKLTS